MPSDPSDLPTTLSAMIDSLNGAPCPRLPAELQAYSAHCISELYGKDVGARLEMLKDENSALSDLLIKGTVSVDVIRQG